jgi:ribonuclease P protein component
MIASRYKIQKQAFPTVMRGPLITGSFFRVIITPSVDDPKIAVVIAKKQAKLAVTRNFIKRIVFRGVRPILISLPKKSIVFLLTRKITLDPNYSTYKNHQHIRESLEQDIQQLIQTIIKRYGNHL